MPRRSIQMLLVLVLLGVMVPMQPSQAAPIANDPFQRTWQRTDKPVADGAVSRTWMWGPEPFSVAKTEDYAESPGSKRTVQYFDKSRMEITNPDGDQSSSWYVTNGLLVVELMSGRMQVGNNVFEDRQPAQINVAGDPDDPLTYAVLAGLRGHAPLTTGATITQRVNASGQVADDPSLAHYGVTAATQVDATKHTVASPFWNFMTASGTVYEDGAMTNDTLFEDPYYATGLPITEAYWADVKVGGQQREVLLQCFERRCLTYTPGNDPAWQVEAGNVGQHYYRWRYPDAAPGPSAQANALALAVTQATSDEARFEALLDVMDALGIGVYAASGEQILGGAERGVGDFYLYDQELWMMAASIGRGDTWSIHDVALLLTNIPILESGGSVDAELLRQVLVDGTKEAMAAPADQLSLVPLLVRQLGLNQAHPYDLSTDVALDAVRFDPLSYFLVISDFTVPIVAEHGPVQSSSTLVAQSQGVLKQTASDNPCGSQIGNGVKESWAFGKWLLGFAKKIGPAMKTAAVVIDGIHGAILAYLVQVSSKTTDTQTHYGHESAGKELQFKVEVKMLEDLPENVIKCGWLLGVEFPKKGGIPGVTVVWFEGSLDEHGEIVCGATCQKTDENGIATMIFRPKKEQNPGEGNVVTEIGTITAAAMYLSRHKNVIGRVNEVATPKTAVEGWSVEHHELPGYKITMDMIYDVNAKLVDSGVTATYIGSGSVSYTVWIPGTAVEPPHDWGSDGFKLALIGEGSGTFTTTYVTEPDHVMTCGGSWKGSIIGTTHFLIAGDYPADDEPIRNVQVNVLGPEPASYTAAGDACPGGSVPDMAAYLGTVRGVPRNIDLTNRAVQTFTVPTSEGCVNLGFESCSGSSKWNVYVEVTKPAG